ncbi:MAG: alpha/beta fold hydrolase [Bacteroidota bacterium]|nr:alpha/beta fold hydrolase [Bacteroidota bacterium]
MNLIKRKTGNDLRADLKHLTVSYNDNGPEDAGVIIFIHGFPLNKSMWNKQVEAFKDTCRVIAYDIRGHGDSDEGKEDFSIELFVNDLIAFMDALEITKAALCGLSMGGYIALNAVENYPERFDALILCDTQCTEDSIEAKEKRLATIESIKKDGVEKYADASLKKLFAPISFAGKKVEVAAVREMIINTSEKTLSNTLLALAGRKESCSKLSEIKIPVLILVGKEDQITPPEVSRMMNNEIPDAELYILEHAGHLSNMESPFEFNKQVKIFITVNKLI